MTKEFNTSEGIWKYLIGHVAVATFSLGTAVSIAKSRYITAYWEEPLALFLIGLFGNIVFAVVAMIFYIFWQRAENRFCLSVSILLCWAMGITLIYTLLYVGLVSIARLPSLVEFALTIGVGVLGIVAFIKIEADHVTEQPMTFLESIVKVQSLRSICLALLCASPLIFLNIFHASDIVSEILKPSVNFSNIKPLYFRKDKTIAFDIKRKGPAYYYDLLLFKIPDDLASLHMKEQGTHWLGARLSFEHDKPKSYYIEPVDRSSILDNLGPARSRDVIPSENRLFLYYEMGSSSGKIGVRIPTWKLCSGLYAFVYEGHRCREAFCFAISEEEMSD